MNYETSRQSTVGFTRKQKFNACIEYFQENKPLHSFEDNSDYVYDARWSPIHPALFATVDGMGRLDLWNLNNDTEVPTASTHVEGQVALNKCRWHQNGNLIAAGDDVGKIHIYDVGEVGHVNNK